MEKHLGARIAARRKAALGQLLAQLAEFTGQPRPDVQLLAVDDHIQRIRQVLGGTGLDLKFGQALVGGT
jgi:hypothetical protein